MIEESYSHFPSVENLKKVLKRYPRAALSYIKIYYYTRYSKGLRKKGDRFCVNMDQIKSLFETSPTLFRNNLTALQDLNLISFEDRTDRLLIGFNDDSGK